MKAPAVSIPEEYTKNPLRQMPEGTNHIRGTTLILQISLQRLRTSYVFPVTGDSGMTYCCFSQLLRDDILFSRYICFTPAADSLKYLTEYDVVLFFGFWCFITLICCFYNSYYSPVF